MPLPATATARSAPGFRDHPLGAVKGKGVDKQVETGVAVEEVGQKERRPKERATAKTKASIVQDGTPSAVAPSATIYAVSTASTVLPSQPGGIDKTGEKRM